MLMGAVALAGIGPIIATAKEERYDAPDTPKQPKEPPPEVAADYTPRQLREARKARIADGATDIPEDDRCRLEAAEAKRRRKSDRLR